MVFSEVIKMEKRKEKKVEEAFKGMKIFVAG